MGVSVLLLVMMMMSPSGDASMAAGADPRSGPTGPTPGVTSFPSRIRRRIPFLPRGPVMGGLSEGGGDGLLPPALGGGGGGT